ncbi:MAG: SDR family NAD(P)-dependent oxidoreductase [Planctomycetes bacterium]|nr:SDR family NAD(P)-dependent oxidoreductase [Planctomycetota bacterium]
MTGAGRFALITGASSGIGEAVARLAAEEGWRVALLGRRHAELERVRASLPPCEHVSLVCDVTDEGAVVRALAEVERSFGRLDLLVNSAGTGYRDTVEDLALTLARRVFETNVLGLLACSKHALPLLKRSAAGVVVNVSSVVGRRAVPGQAVYSASKAAVCSLGEALRIEWASHGVAVCTLNPGLTSTGFFAAQANPRGLADPDMARADGAADVARAVMELVREPRPELYLRPKWRWIAALTPLAPRTAERLFARRIGGRKSTGGADESWRAPER